MHSYFNLAENPLFIKHVRSRMRRAQLVPSIIMVCFFSLCIVVLELKVLRPGPGYGSVAFFIMQGIILLLMGGSQVAAAVASIKESGMLDFHRITPVPARVQVLGFLLGAPIREWMLFACTLPFALFLAATGPWGVVGFTKVLLVQMTGAMLYHSLGLVTGLAGKSARGASGRVVGIIVLLNIVSNNLNQAGVAGPSLLSPIPVLREVMDEAEEVWRQQAQRNGWAPAPPRVNRQLIQQPFKPNFYGQPVPLVVQTLVFQASIFVFLMIAATRRFRSTRLSLYSKPHALAFTATLIFLTLGSLWETEPIAITLATAYFLTFMALWLIATVTPQLGDFMKGLQRARRKAGGHLSIWSDLASNQVAVFALALLILGALAVANFVAPGPPALGRQGPPVFPGQRGPAFEPWAPMAVAVLAVLSFGWALQYFHLRYGRRAPSFFGLYIFGAWVVPIVVGALGSIAKVKDMNLIMAISPFAGIAMSGLANLGLDPTMAPLFSIVPPAILTLLFGGLLLSEERRRAEQVQKEYETRPSGGPKEPVELHGEPEAKPYDQDRDEPERTDSQGK